MKKIFFFMMIVFASVFSIHLAHAQSNSGSVKLRLILNPIQTLVVNSSQESIDLVYSETSDYVNGVSTEQQDHLKINSTGAFTINVQSQTDNVSRASGTETISAHTMRVRALAGTTNAMKDATMSEVNLSTTATNLITSKTGGMGTNFNIIYSGAGADGYINSFYDNESPTVYTTTVTYTIAAK